MLGPGATNNHRTCVPVVDDQRVARSRSTAALGLTHGVQHPGEFDDVNGKSRELPDGQRWSAGHPVRWHSRILGGDAA